VDLSNPEEAEQHGDVIDFVQEQSLPYPLVAINGELRLAGSAEYYRIMPLVEGALQEKAELATKTT
jgi:hypothetical protein